MSTTIDLAVIHPLEGSFDQFGRFCPFPRPKTTKPIPNAAHPDFLRPCIIDRTRIARVDGTWQEVVDYTRIAKIDGILRVVVDEDDPCIGFTEKKEQSRFERKMLLIRAYLQADGTYEVYAFGRVPVTAKDSLEAKAIMRGLIDNRRNYIGYN